MSQVKRNHSGLYIVIEGQDGAGKTTQVAKLAEYFRGEGREVVVVNEGAEHQSGLAATDAIGKTLHRRDFALLPETNLLLFTAQRVELWQKIIAPALARDAVVLASRNWWSTLAYQHFGEGVPRNLIEEMTRNFLPERYISPDKSVILTIDHATRTARTKNRSQQVAKDTFDAREKTFFDRANRGYETLARELGIAIVDAGGTVGEVLIRLRDIVST